MRIGFKLIAEGYGPREIVQQAIAAEQAGLDFVEVSDHYHPWLDSQGHSGYAFAMLGAIAQATDRIELATGVSCPIMRQHPAVVAQAAATLGVLSEGRFTLGVGSGERLNEHVTGQGWPSVSVRHTMLREALEIIHLLWRGGYRSYAGEHFTVDDARIFDLPAQPPRLAVAAGGPRASRIAAELGDALFVTEARPELVAAYREAGGSGQVYGEVPMSYAATEQEGAASARELFRLGVLGWKVQPELPNPASFEAASSWVGEEDLRQAFACGPDLDRQLEVATQFTDAGVDQLALINAGPDMGGFFAHVRDELGPALRAGG